MKFNTQRTGLHTLKMAAETSSKTSFTIYQSTRHHIADDLPLQEAKVSTMFESGGKYFDMREGGGEETGEWRN